MRTAISVDPRGWSCARSTAVPKRASRGPWSCARHSCARWRSSVGRRWRGRTTGSWSAVSCSSKATRCASATARPEAFPEAASGGDGPRREPRLHALRDVADLLDVLDEALACLLGRGLQVRELLDPPVLEDDGYEDLVVV